MIEADIRSALIASTGVTALVGDRISALVAPEGETRPYITYQVVSDDRHYTLCGASDLRMGRVQVVCHAPEYGQAKQLSRLTIDAIESWAGFDVVYNGLQDLFDPATKLYYAVLDYSIWQKLAP